MVGWIGLDDERVVMTSIDLLVTVVWMVVALVVDWIGKEEGYLLEIVHVMMVIPVRSRV